jgi:mRNA interferase MazF
MPKDCAVNCDHLQTVLKKRLGPLITMVSPAHLDTVSEAIGFALDV